MKKLYSLALVGLALAPLFASAQAQVVDQSNYAPGSPFGYGYEATGQTFTPSYATVAGAGFNLQDYQGSGTSGNLTVALYNAPGGTLLASGTTAFSLGSYQQAYFDVFWTPVAVTPSTSYFLAAVTNTGLSAVFTGSTTNNYTSGGWQYANASTDLNGPYTDLSSYGYDMNFEEFATAAPAAVPEPASLVLVATGLVGVFGIGRRRNKTLA